MRKFAELFDALDSTTKTNAKVEALTTYFQETNQEDLLFSIALIYLSNARITSIYRFGNCPCLFG